MRITSMAKGAALGALVAGAGIAGVAAPTPAQAGQPYFEMSCSELWYERNAVYAFYGYCFKSAKGRAAFPDSCHSPFGRLPRRAERQINEIKQVEEDKGCN